MGMLSLLIFYSGYHTGGDEDEQEQEQKHAQILEDSFIYEQVIQAKWNEYGARRYYKMFLYHLFLTLVTYGAIFFRPNVTLHDDIQLAWWQHGVIVPPQFLRRPSEFGDDVLADYVRVFFEILMYPF